MDGFDFDESLDAFSDEKKEKDDNQSLSDGSATKSKDRRHKKEKKEKKHKKEREKKEKDVEKVVKSTVNEEIEVLLYSQLIPTIKMCSRIMYSKTII